MPLGTSPFQRLIQIHWAETTCTTVSRADFRLLPRSFVHCSGDSFETASNIRVSAQRV